VLATTSLGTKNPLNRTNLKMDKRAERKSLNRRLRAEALAKNGMEVDGEGDTLDETFMA
jgi:hypothetical protein